MNLELSNINSKAVSTLLDNKIDELKSSTISSKRKYSDEEKSKLAETTRGFEAIFINMMYKGMKSAMLDTLSDSSAPDMTFGNDVLGGYTDMIFAEQMANTDTGIGIASMMYKQITGEDLKPIRQIKTTELTSLLPIFENKTDEKNAPIKFNLANNNSNSNPNGNFLGRVEKRISNYSKIISDASKEYQIPEPLIKAVITAESAGRYDAKSPVGAKGLMQLMDGTAKGLGVKNSYDPYQNIMGGTKYLRQMLNNFGGKLDFALAAYNAGPGNVRKYDGIPPFNETQNYVKKVKSYFQHFAVNGTNQLVTNNNNNKI
ncbi:MAG: transglycosylase SLT domain-containing protein [Ignavibacteria bacterium]|jgi:Rod binding domain-containing protein|nr:transglycosylase SLT domain-containing protein [Ignavibacteria bacterium]